MEMRNEGMCFVVELGTFQFRDNKLTFLCLYLSYNPSILKHHVISSSPNAILHLYLNLAGIYATFKLESKQL